MRKGFTLLELLVVVAIIGILTAIILPVFVTVRENGKISRCTSQGRELGMAMQMYMDDNNGCCPSTLGNDEAEKAITTIMWQNKLTTFKTQLWSLRFSKFNDYVKSSGVWICPSITGDLGRRYAYGYKQTWIPRLQDEFLPYEGAKGDLGLTNGLKVASDGRVPGRTIGEIEHLDKRSPRQKIAWYCCTIGSKVPTPPLWDRNTYPYYPHRGGSVYVYLDGHAEWAKVGGFWAPKGYLRYDH